MKVIESKDGAIGAMIGALILLGTWPAIFCGLERAGRHPAHTFLDYSICNFITAVIVALTLGQIGAGTPEAPNFIDQLHQDIGPSVGFAIGGGILLCLGNLAVQYAIAFVGLAVAETVTASMTVAGGTLCNYFLDGRINKAEVLFPGVGFFLIAVFLGSFLHIFNTRDNDRKLGVKPAKHAIQDDITRPHKEGAHATTGIGSPYIVPDAAGLDDSAHHADGFKKVDVSKDPESTSPHDAHAAYLASVESKRAIKVGGRGFVIGLIITAISGGSYILFAPALNLATNDQWHQLAPGVPHLSVYTAYFFFAASFAGLAIILNVTFLYFPILGLPKSGLKAYIMDWRLRPWSILAGIVCGWGNALQFMGGQAAGYAAADSVQALPLVSTFWAILVFHEYRRSSRTTYILLVAMLVMFAIAVGLLMGSAGTRKTE